ncbi:MAG: glycosyltransferase, partial [Muribaculaceae bacterium]|nr:glycosyltransferase [Muribaculaceae bacterium]
MKIIHVIFTFRTGGAETMLVDIMNRQVALGHDVTLLIINDGVDRALLATVSPQVRVVHWPRRPGTRRLLLAARLNAWVRLRRPDVVHLHDPKLPGLIRGLDSRLVYTIHALGLSQRYLRPSVRQVAITDAVRDDALAARPDADISVISNGIDINAIRRRDQSRLPAPGAFRIVQSGRLDTATKGQDILIRALAILCREGFDGITVDFIGEGADRQALENLAADLGVARK